MDKSKKKRIKRYIAWACLAALVVLLTVMPLVAKNDAAADGPHASILTATLETGSITTTVRGGGNLEEQDAQDVMIPTGVKITEFLVKNGDAVTAGTPVAAVDKISVMEAITSVNDTMKYLQTELEEGRDEKVEEAILAVPGGRVKKIFAQEGETVQEVMLRDGALAVLSIDSMMAVEIETVSSFATGQSVEVTLADKTVVTGRVESNLDGKVVVTVEDEGYEVGQEVAVKDLGTGTLYIHNAWKATAISGTISKVHAKEEQTLQANAGLFTLTDRDFTGQLQHRANQHREYEELLQTLLKMQESGTIDAPCDGIVSGVDADSVHLLSSDGEWEMELLGGTGESVYRIVFLSGETDCDCEGSEHETTCRESCINATEKGTCPYEGEDHKENCIELCTPAGPTCNANVHQIGCISYCGGTANPYDCANVNGGYHQTNCIRRCINAGKNETCPGGANHYLSCIESCQYDAATKTCPGTGDHKNNCIQSCVHADYTGICESNVHYDDCIEACVVSTNANEECPASKHKDGCFFYGMTYTAKAAIVNQIGSTQLKVYQDDTTVYTVQPSSSGWVIVSPVLNTELMITEGWVTVTDPSQFLENDVILMITGYKNAEATWSGVKLYQRTTTGGTGTGLGTLGDASLSGMMGGMDLSGMTGGFSGFGNYNAQTTQESENLHDLEGSTLLTVTPHKTMELTITLDEQDIARITPGMRAKVKVEALRGQEFQAEVTEVAISGTNNGGSSKFTAKLQLDAASDMLSGMSASAILELETREDILTLPVAALYELDGKTVVYTSLDEESQEPANPVAVVTGVSDGETVEILSGLNRGDTVYYSYYDTLEEDVSAQASRFTFG